MSRVSALLTLLLLGNLLLAAQASEGVKSPAETEKLRKEHLAGAPGKSSAGSSQKSLTRTPKRAKPAGSLAKAESDKSLANYKKNDYKKLLPPAGSASKADIDHRVPKKKTASKQDSENAEKEHEHHGEAGCESLKSDVAKEKCRREEKLGNPATGHPFKP